MTALLNTIAPISKGQPKAITPTITEIGLATASNAHNTGIEVAITHIAFGRAQYSPTGAEVVLQDEVMRVAIAGGGKLSPTQIQVHAEAIAPSGAAFWCGEIGFFSGDILFAVFSRSTVPILYFADDNVTTLSYTLGWAALPKDLVTVIVDPNVNTAIQLIGAHETAANPHPQYLRKANNLSEIEDRAVACENLGAVNAEFVNARIDVAKESLVARTQLPIFNLHRDSGRFFDIDLPANRQLRRQIELHNAAFHVGQVTLYNGTTATNAGRFIHNNSNFGGVLAELNPNVLSLLEAMQRSNRRYGVEFHIAEFVASSEPGTESPATLPNGNAWLSTVTFGNTQGTISSMYWIRVLNGQTLLAAATYYRNGVLGSALINPEDGWVHICEVEDWDGGYTHLNHMHAIPGSRYQIALPAMVPGDLHGVIHKAPILGFEY